MLRRPKIRRPPTRAFFIASALTASLLTSLPAAAQDITAPATGTVVPLSIPLSPLSQTPSPQTIITPPPTTVPAQLNLGSFSDRTLNCLNQGAASGLDPNSLSNYERGCAN